MSDRILHDQCVDVFYSHENPTEDKNSGYKRYNHVAVYIPSKKRIDQFVYCRNEKDHQALVNNWNRMAAFQPEITWVYYIP